MILAMNLPALDLDPVRQRGYLLAANIDSLCEVRNLSGWLSPCQSTRECREDIC